MDTKMRDREKERLEQPRSRASGGSSENFRVSAKSASRAKRIVAKLSQLNSSIVCEIGVALKPTELIFFFCLFIWIGIVVKIL